MLSIKGPIARVQSVQLAHLDWIRFGESNISPVPEGMLLRVNCTGHSQSTFIGLSEHIDWKMVDCYGYIRRPAVTLVDVSLLDCYKNYCDKQTETFHMNDHPAPPDILTEEQMFPHDHGPYPKQDRYLDSGGNLDHIDECARDYSIEEFRGAMKFTVGKYLKRLGKKDSIIQELTKIHDYIGRWLAYEKNKVE